MSYQNRQSHAAMFGPTLGDCVRLADTDLWARVEKDFTVYGDEIKFGGGKVIRDGMGQSARAKASPSLGVGVAASTISKLSEVGMPVGRLTR